MFNAKNWTPISQNAYVQRAGHGALKVMIYAYISGFGRCLWVSADVKAGDDARALELAKERALKMGLSGSDYLFKSQTPALNSESDDYECDEPTQDEDEYPHWERRDVDDYVEVHDPYFQADFGED